MQMQKPVVLMIHVLMKMQVANDAWEDGAENHDDTNEEGKYKRRQKTAIRVWNEFIGTRLLPGKSGKEIYRSFQFGKIINLIMTETRHTARDEQLDEDDYFAFGAGVFNNESYTRDVFDLGRTMLGTKQLSWVEDSVCSSEASWQVIGSSVVMAKHALPLQIVMSASRLEEAFIYGDQGELVAAVTEYLALAHRLIGIKMRLQLGDTTLTPDEIALLEPAVYKFLDQWDGYNAARERLYDVLRCSNVIGLAGDTHNAWYSWLVDDAGRKIGDEFATASVTSPGYDLFTSNLSPPQAALFNAVFEVLIDDVKYFQNGNRGYTLITFNKSRAVADYFIVDSVFDPVNYAVTLDNTITVAAGTPQTNCDCGTSSDLSSGSEGASSEAASSSGYY